MSYRKAKTAPKVYITDQKVIQELVLETMKEISDLVGRTLGPGGKIILLESDHIGIKDRLSKDGISVFSSMAHRDPYKHAIIETARDSSMKTATDAGDGTTSTTVLAEALIRNIFKYCELNPKESPQKIVRRIKKVMTDTLLPYIESRSVKISEENVKNLEMVAKISANGDIELAKAVLECFSLTGYGDSHVTLREVIGPSELKSELIDGFPIPIGLEETCGKYFSDFQNDAGNQCAKLENPKFILFDGTITDLVQFGNVLNALGDRYVSGDKTCRDLVIVAHGFSELVISTLAFNFKQSGTMNVVPLKTPQAQFINSQTHALVDLAAFTGAKVFGMANDINLATIEDLGMGMTFFESYRFRSNVLGEPDPVNVEVRAEELKTMKKRAESRAEQTWFDERLGKITNGISKLTVSGGTSAETRERIDRAEDAICAVRSSMIHGCLPGGCRIAIDLALLIAETMEEGDPARETLLPSLLSLPTKLLANSGYNEEEVSEVLKRLVENPGQVFDIENHSYGDPFELGILDATRAVSAALENSVSIAGALGNLGGICVHPRDDQFERTEAKLDNEFTRATENPDAFQNPALRRR